MNMNERDLKNHGIHAVYVNTFQSLLTQKYKKTNINLNKMRHNLYYAAFCLKRKFVWIIDIEVGEDERILKSFQ